MEMSELYISVWVRRCFSWKGSISVKSLEAISPINIFMVYVFITYTLYLPSSHNFNKKSPLLFRLSVREASTCIQAHKSTINFHLMLWVCVRLCSWNCEP